jgi:hypothetical protein
MNKLDYTYIFEDISSISRCVKVVDHRIGEPFTIEVAVKDYQLLHQNQVPAKIADLVDLAVTVHIADRMAIRQEDMPCQIHVVLPMRHPEIFDRLPVVECLQDILYWYTGDYWWFEFIHRTTCGRPVELQK